MSRLLRDTDILTANITHTLTLMSFGKCSTAGQLAVTSSHEITSLNLEIVMAVTPC